MGSHPHFVNWFPQLRSEFEYILRHKCWSDYQIYLNDQYQNYENPLHWKPCTSCAIAPVAGCLYNNGFGLAGANMGTAGVVLGLLPTILIFAGSSKVETGLLALRRPLFSMLISLASPAVNPLHAVDYNAPSDILQLWEGSKRHHIPVRNSVSEVLALALQYLIVLAAIVNIAEVTYEFCFWAVCSFSPETTYLPALYPALTLVGHFMGAEAVRRRVRLVSRDRDDSEPFNEGMRSWLGFWICNEIHLTGSRPTGRRGKTLLLKLENETYAFLITNWLLSTLATMHLVLGTLVFSSILFISTRDAAFVAARYLISAVAVRLVLTYELGGLGQVADVERPVRVPWGSESVTVDDEMAEREREPFARATTV